MGQAIKTTETTLTDVDGFKARVPTDGTENAILAIKAFTQFHDPQVPLPQDEAEAAAALATRSTQSPFYTAQKTADEYTFHVVLVDEATGEETATGVVFVLDDDQDADQTEQDGEGEQKAVGVPWPAKKPWEEGPVVDKTNSHKQPVVNGSSKKGKTQERHTVSKGGTKGNKDTTVSTNKKDQPSSTTGISKADAKIAANGQAKTSPKAPAKQKSGSKKSAAQKDKKKRGFLSRFYSSRSAQQTGSRSGAPAPRGGGATATEPTKSGSTNAVYNPETRYQPNPLAPSRIAERERMPIKSLTAEEKQAKAKAKEAKEAERVNKAQEMQQPKQKKKEELNKGEKQAHDQTAIGNTTTVHQREAETGAETHLGASDDRVPASNGSAAGETGKRHDVAEGEGAGLGTTSAPFVAFAPPVHPVGRFTCVEKDDHGGAHLEFPLPEAGFDPETAKAPVQDANGTEDTWSSGGERAEEGFPKESEHIQKPVLFAPPVGAVGRFTTIQDEAGPLANAANTGEVNETSAPVEDEEGVRKSVDTNSEAESLAAGATASAAAGVQRSRPVRGTSVGPAAGDAQPLSSKEKAAAVAEAGSSSGLQPETRVPSWFRRSSLKLKPKPPAAAPAQQDKKKQDPAGKEEAPAAAPGAGPGADDAAQEEARQAAASASSAEGGTYTKRAGADALASSDGASDATAPGSGAIANTSRLREELRSLDGDGAEKAAAGAYLCYVQRFIPFFFALFLLPVRC